jgi:hypothetical protein
MRIALIAGLLLLGIAEAAICHGPSPEVEVLVNGAPVPRYYHRETTYIEAIKGKEYEIRITNPTGSRIAVALSVDGLNTIDARHTEARSARKWVLEPYQSIVISGWQTNSRQARRFFFTTEERSYGAWLHKTDNLGIISAVFFRERTSQVQPTWSSPAGHDFDKSKERAEADAAGSERPQSSRGEAKAALSNAEPEYAATGIGDRIRHEVRPIYMDLEDQPFATFSYRYEFRPALVRLGVVPPRINDDPLARRERSKGFQDGNFCPEP